MNKKDYEDRGQLEKFYATPVSYERENTEILNELNVEKFIPRIEKYKVTIDEIRNQLLNKVKKNCTHSEMCDLLPLLYVNFDECKLYTLELNSGFEDFLTDNWEGKYFYFLDLLPSNYRFWE